MNQDKLYEKFTALQAERDRLLILLIRGFQLMRHHDGSQRGSVGWVRDCWNEFSPETRKLLEESNE